jgi:hypothetical protein
MDARKISVEHDYVVVSTANMTKGVVAVEGHVDRHTGPTEPLRYSRGELGVVFDQQHPQMDPSVNLHVVDCRSQPGRAWRGGELSWEFVGPTMPVGR